jgi:hypothetical protein
MKIDLRLSLLVIACAWVSGATAQSSPGVSESAASKLLLDTYPGLLTNAYLVGPHRATLESDVPDFAKSGENVWYIEVMCQKGRQHALFFVHPFSAKIYPVVRPGSRDSTKCT